MEIHVNIVFRVSVFCSGMALTYRFERYGLDLTSLILHALVSPIKSLQHVFT